MANIKLSRAKNLSGVEDQSEENNSTDESQPLQQSLFQAPAVRTNPPPSKPVVKSLQSSNVSSSSLLKTNDMGMSIAIDLLKSEARRWEDMYKEILAENKEKDKTIKTLEDQVREKQSSLQGLENKAPSWFEKIPDHYHAAFAPALGTVIQKLMGAIPAAGGMGDVGGQLDEAGQQRITEINTWYCSLPKATQDHVYELLNHLADCKSESELNDTLSRIANLFQYGTTIQTPNILTPTGS